MHSWKKNKQTRIHKFAKYRQTILRMKQKRVSVSQVFLAKDVNLDPTIKPFQVFMWFVGAGVIILLILVVALIYFGR
jgi:uncharacterized membrane protein